MRYNKEFDKFQLGHNSIPINYKYESTVGYDNKIYIGTIPANSYLRMAYVDIIKPFLGNTRPFEVGIYDDDDYIIDEASAASEGKTGKNSGDYFDDPKVFDKDCKVYVKFKDTRNYVWTASNTTNFSVRYPMGFGLQDAAVRSGGDNGTTYISTSEEYDGTSWSTGGDMNIARYAGDGAGILTAGLSVSGGNGAYLASTEEYNGTSWSTGGDVNDARQGIGVCGSQTSALMFGGYNGYTFPITTEEYDGTSWSSGTNTLSDGYGACASGIQNAALKIQRSASTTTRVEEYDGTSWSIVDPTSINVYFSQSCGTVLSTLKFGGAFIPGSASRSEAEHYDGTSWSYVANMLYSRRYFMGTGTGSLALEATGYNSTYENTSSEYGGREAQDHMTTGLLNIHLLLL